MVNGFALVTALWWIAGISAVLTVLFLVTAQQTRLGVKIQERIDHVYFAEAIFAGEINRLKTRSWYNRWYREPGQSDDSIHGKRISGEFEGASYTGYVQDVADHWSQPTTSPAKILYGQTDLFLAVTHPAGRKDAVTRTFFQRIVFFAPSAERPTVVAVRRFARDVGEFDPLDADQRARVLALVNRRERLREWNRPESNVLVREIRHLASRSVPLGQIARSRREEPEAAVPAARWSILAGPCYAGITARERLREGQRPESTVHERELRDLERSGIPENGLWEALTTVENLDLLIEREREMLRHLKRGQRLLQDPAVSGTPNRYGVAVEQFTKALEKAKSQDRPNQEGGSVPMCLYAKGRAEWSHARTYPRTDSVRASLLASAWNSFDEIVRLYPFRGKAFPSQPDFPCCSDTNCNDMREFTGRFEAPHALVRQAFLRIERENPDSPDGPDEYNKAIVEARATLERLRTCYPYFHLWGEDAITARQHEGPTDRADETVWHLEQLLPAPVFVLGGLDNSAAGVFSYDRRIYKLNQQTKQWIEAGRLNAARHAFSVTEPSPVPGTNIGGRFLILGGVSRVPPDTTKEGEVKPGAEIYDPIESRIWVTAGQMAEPRSQPGVTALPDGRCLVSGGSNAGSGAVLASCELFDPRTESFSAAAPMNAPRAGHEAVALQDGRVLVTGGVTNRDESLSSGEVYDPQTNVWTPVQSELKNEGRGRTGHRMVALDDGSVLIAGGNDHDAGASFNWAELYDPKTNTFSQVGSMASPRGDFFAVKMRSGPSKGHVLVGSGVANTVGPIYSGSAEEYDPTQRTFSPAGTVAGRSAPCAEALPDGRVVVSGGWQNPSTTFRSVDVFDPATRGWTQAEQLPSPMVLHFMPRPHQ